MNLRKSLPITKNNYLGTRLRLQILLTRYENKRLITSKHLERILDIEPCSDRSQYSVRELLNVFQENMEALDVMGFQFHPSTYFIT